VLFEDEKISHTLLDEISTQSNLPTLIIAETEKYAHVTYFFRSKVDIELPNETRILIPSLKVKSYSDVPEMSAPEITQQVVNALNDYQFFLVNFANCDMVAHSGDIHATIKACECVDKQLEILYKEVVEKRGGTIFVTGDHGNAEEMIDVATGQVKTAHTTNPVPFMVLGDKIDISDVYGLSDIAPLILKHLGLVVPKKMSK
jgi:2,3-bisphosphoglycerate-independent phosphoglycerate mutase